MSSPQLSTVPQTPATRNTALSAALSLGLPSAGDLKADSSPGWPRDVASIGLDSLRIRIHDLILFYAIVRADPKGSINFELTD